MSTQFAFRANQITVSLPADSNHIGDNSTLTFTTQPAADPVSDAVNNVRFACTGFAGHGAVRVLLTLKTHHTFIFQPQAEGRLTAHTHFMPQGGFSLTARKPTWLFDSPGFVTFNVFMRMRVRIVGANGVEVLRAFTPNVNIFSAAARARSVSVSREGAVDADLLEFSSSRAFATIVVPSDTIEVQARYTVQTFAGDGAEFFLDFASTPAFGGEPGDGLNAPFAVINIAE